MPKNSTNNKIHLDVGCHFNNFGNLHSLEVRVQTQIFHFGYIGKMYRHVLNKSSFLWAKLIEWMYGLPVNDSSKGVN